MPKKKLNYREGCWFILPLRNGGYARGMVARMNGQGGVFGYFFGPKISSLGEGTNNSLEPEQAILIGDFGDLGLINGEWTVGGMVPGWNRADWAMSPRIRVDRDANRAWLSEYDEETFELVSEREVDPSLEKDYPYDRTMGYGAVEIRLTRLLDPSVSGD